MTELEGMKRDIALAKIVADNLRKCPVEIMDVFDGPDQECEPIENNPHSNTRHIPSSGQGRELADK